LISFRLTNQIAERDMDISKKDVPIYRLPRGLRRRAKEEKKEEGKSISNF